MYVMLVMCAFLDHVCNVLLLYRVLTRASPTLSHVWLCRAPRVPLPVERLTEMSAEHVDAKPNRTKMAAAVRVRGTLTAHCCAGCVPCP